MDIGLKKIKDEADNAGYLFFESGNISKPILFLEEYQLKNLLRKHKKDLLETD